jgi:hypothetical protein
MGLVLRPRCAGGANAAGGPMVFDQGRPLQPWEIAQQLPGAGLAMAKQLAGDVTWSALGGSFSGTIECNYPIQLYVV